jgi:hypothetical protein
MKKRFYILVAVAALLLITPQVFAQYNRDAVVSVMRDSYKLIGEINAAANSEDFFTTAVKLMELAEGFKTLEQTPPPRGSRTEWDRIHNELIAAAFRGIGACGDRDGRALKAEISTIMALNQEGHGKFQ